MFFDPQCKPEVSPVAKPDIYALPTLIAWLEKQPADRVYEYCDPFGCLIAQYLKQSGAKKIDLLAEEVEALFSGRGSQVAQGRWDLGYKRTFGTALERARKLL